LSVKKTYLSIPFEILDPIFLKIYEDSNWEILGTTIANEKEGGKIGMKLCGKKFVDHVDSTLGNI
jgi:hypothetical protein